MTTSGKTKTLAGIFFGLVIFVGFVYFNYLRAQKAISETKPAPLSVDLISFPEKIKIGLPAHFVWQVKTSPDLSTAFTTIYWGYESSPSALTRSDSPAAVRYPHYQLDYAQGLFRLPYTFDLNIIFSRPGRVWFRAYSLIRGEHLWSPEMSLEVIK